MEGYYLDKFDDATGIGRDVGVCGWAGVVLRVWHMQLALHEQEVP
jgi:hypothetical protein